MNATALPRAGRREWIGVAALALPCMLVVMDLSVLFLAVPSLTRDLHPSATQLLWITDVYGFLIAGALIAMGSSASMPVARAGGLLCVQAECPMAGQRIGVRWIDMAP